MSKIIGGSVRARREIRAAVLGSDAGTRTDLQVAYDPELMAQYHSLIKEMQRIQEDSNRIKEALYVLYRLQVDSTLPPDKKAAMAKLEQFQKEAPENLQVLMQQKADIETALQQYSEASIICEEIMYPGVKASFGIVYREIVEEHQHCKLSLEAGRVLISDFKG